MSPELVGVIGVVLLLVLMAARVWIGLAMAIVGFLGIVYIQGFAQAFMVIGRMPYQFTTNYAFTVMPMFILMGMVASQTGIATDLYYAAHKWVGQVRGGLAMATTAACALFSALVGSTTAGVMVFGKVAIPEMKKYGYDDALSTGTLAASSTMGILIPPSIGFIIYGLLTQQSVGKLFMAGIIPGVIQAAVYILLIYTMCRINPRLGPAGPRTSFKEKIFSLRYIWAMVVLFLLVMGGIYMGIFTPTEAGAVGAFGAIVIAIISRRFTSKGFLSSLLDTGLMTAMIMFILAGASIFMKFMAVSNLPFWLSEVVTGAGLPPLGVLIAITVMLIILGTALPALLTIILTVPILYPVVLALGFDPIWFGVICVVVVEMGEISPPEGMSMFILSSVSGVPIGTIFRGVLPFFASDFARLALLIAFPQIALFLPSLMK